MRQHHQMLFETCLSIEIMAGNIIAKKKYALAEIDCKVPPGMQSMIISLHASFVIGKKQTRHPWISSNQVINSCQFSLQLFKSIAYIFCVLKLKKFESVFWKIFFGLETNYGMFQFVSRCVIAGPEARSSAKKIFVTIHFIQSIIERI